MLARLDEREQINARARHWRADAVVFRGRKLRCGKAVRTESASFELSEAEQIGWREYLQRECGFDVPENRLRAFRQALEVRVAALGLRSFSEYYYFLLNNSQAASEKKELIEEITVKETSFFRHQPSFDALEKVLLPEILRRKQLEDSTRIRMWSAACSTGQEAYSMAMTFLQKSDPFLYQVEIVGTDISQKALQKASRGRYLDRELAQIPVGYKNSHFLPLLGEAQLYEIDERLRSRVSFRYGNLVDEASLDVPLQDVIFCQNVLIYFTPQIRREVIERLCRRLVRGGFLVLTPIEVMGARPTGVRLRQIGEAYIYERV